MIRYAHSSDAIAIAKIYNQAITDGSYATCDLEPVSAENRVEWLKQHQTPYPAFVWENQRGEVIGYATLSPFSIRPIYLSLAEVAVYIEQSKRHGIVGGRLLAHLIKTAKQLGFRSLVALILEKNYSSLQGAVGFGFQRVAYLPEVALMKGKWEGVVWVQKVISHY
ncbi:MAG: N-acetyltransferase family protein [Halothece sp.]